MKRVARAWLFACMALVGGSASALDRSMASIAELATAADLVVVGTLTPQGIAAVQTLKGPAQPLVRISNPSIDSRAMTREGERAIFFLVARPGEATYRLYDQTAPMEDLTSVELAIAALRDAAVLDAMLSGPVASPVIDLAGVRYAHRYVLAPDDQPGADRAVAYLSRALDDAATSGVSLRMLDRVAKRHGADAARLLLASEYVGARLDAMQYLSRSPDASAVPALCANVVDTRVRGDSQEVSDASIALARIRTADALACLEQATVRGNQIAAVGLAEWRGKAAFAVILEAAAMHPLSRYSMLSSLFVLVRDSNLPPEDWMRDYAQSDIARWRAWWGAHEAELVAPGRR